MKKEDINYVAIIGGKPIPAHFRIIDAAIEEEWDKDTVPLLFWLLALPRENREITLSDLWGKERGVPRYQCGDRLQLLKKADYVFFVLDKTDAATKRDLMQYKMMENKHGRVILL